MELMISSDLKQMTKVVMTLEISITKRQVTYKKYVKL